MHSQANNNGPIQFTPINPRTPPPPRLNLYIAYMMIQNLSTRSIKRWNQATLDRVMRDPSTDINVIIPAHATKGEKEGSYSREHLADWFRVAMIELINKQLTQEGKAPVDPDAFPVFSEHEDNGSQNTNSDSN